MRRIQTIRLNPTDRRDARKRYEQKRQSDPALAEAKRLRSSARWTELSRLVRAKSPLCCDPFAHHTQDSETVPATQVHHIKGVATHPHLAFSLENLAAVCTQCHARLEAMEDRGEATEHLFGRSTNE